MNQFFSIEEIGIKTKNNVAASPVVSRGLAMTEEKPPINEFEPIGIGKPLVIRFHTLHVGRLKTGIFSKKKSVLVTSLIKDDITYQVSPRGVHQIFKNVTARQTLYPQASNEGTELIYYAKAFDSDKLKVDIEVKADKLNEDTLDNIANTFNHAAGLPVFLPFSSFLLAGSKLMKVSGRLLNKVMNKVPLLSYPFDISEDIGGIRNTSSGYLIGGNPDELRQLKGYEITEDEFSNGNVYLAKDGEKYDGDIPYIIISLDGRSKQRYDNFKATIASASILKKFYGIDETTEVEDIQTMLGLYNDYKYINKIKNAEKRIKDSSDPMEQEKLNKLIEAYRKNIKNEDLKKVTLPVEAIDS